MKKITLSKYAGFCEGVKRAIEITEKAVQSKTAPIYILGHLVHNQRVIKELQKKGVQTISDFNNKNKGTLIISAHGIGPKIKTQITQQGLKVIDTTCPKVIKIHQIVRLLKNKGYQIIVVGDKNHTEVKGIRGWAGEKAIVISSPQEAKKIKIKKQGKVGLVCQSTQEADNLEKISDVLKSQRPDIEIYDTICEPTKKRQSSIKDLAEKKEAIVAIGDQMSANSKRLYEIAKKINPKTYFISAASELKPRWFKSVNEIGITAGASTPDKAIKEVIEKLKKY